MCYRRSFATDKKNNEQNFPNFDPWRLLNNKINKRRESNYEKLLEKDI